MATHGAKLGKRTSNIPNGTTKSRITNPETSGIAKESDSRRRTVCALSAAGPRNPRGWEKNCVTAPTAAPQAAHEARSIATANGLKVNSFVPDREASAKAYHVPP